MANENSRCFLGLLPVLVVIIGVIPMVKCSEYPFSFFTKYPYSKLDQGYNETIASITEGDCLIRCRVKYDFPCLSVDYDFKSNTCYLSVDKPDSLEVLKGWESSNHYVRIIGDCPDPPVGLEDQTIALSQITASSEFGDDTGNEVLKISLDNVRLNSEGAWCAEQYADLMNTTQWIGVDLGEPKYISAVATQGYGNPEIEGMWVKEYFVSYIPFEGIPQQVVSIVDDDDDDDGTAIPATVIVSTIVVTDLVEVGEEEYTILSENENTKIFTGNTDPYETKVNTLSTPIRTRYIRINVKDIQSHPCLRVEFYGCKDDCYPNPCQNGGACTEDLPGVWNVTCQCAVGYTGDLCEINIDECASDPCLNGATCVDKVNGYECECSPGFTDTHCETNIDECASDPCQNDAPCTDFVNGYNCTCSDGYEGDNCQSLSASCDPGQIAGIHACYKIEMVNPDTHTLSKQHCEGLRGHLFYPNSYEEFKSVMESLDSAGADGSENYFLGLVMLDQEDDDEVRSTIQSVTQVGNNTGSDSSSVTIIPGTVTKNMLSYDNGVQFPYGDFTYENGTEVTWWANGYPTGFSTCVALKRQAGKWMLKNIDCTESKYYLCEINSIDGDWGPWSRWSQCSASCGVEGIQNRTRNCNNPLPLLTGSSCLGDSIETRPCQDVCPLVTCPEGFTAGSDSCYKVVTSDVDYDTAKAACEGNYADQLYGGHLALITDFAEQSIVERMLSNLTGASTFYVGNQYTSGNVTFDWEFSNDELNQTTWTMEGAAMWSSENPQDSLTCISLECRMDDSLFLGCDWTSTDCTSTTSGYVCEFKKMNGEWADWALWSHCSVTCGPDTGTRKRIRNCNEPSPILGGFDCDGDETDDLIQSTPISDSQSQSCGAVCPLVDCPDGFIPSTSNCYKAVHTTNKLSYEAAKTACEDLGSRSHIAYINNFDEHMYLDFRLNNVWNATRSDGGLYVGMTYTPPNPANMPPLTYLEYDGQEGEPNRSSWEAAGLEPLSPDLLLDDSSMTTVFMEYVVSMGLWLLGNSDGSQQKGYICEINQGDGDWGSWEAWVACSQSCGNGTQTRSRSCDDPAPIEGGSDCYGNDTETRSCSDPCPIVADYCPQDFSPRYDSCYLMAPVTLDYTYASDECSDDTGHLVYLNTEAELVALHHKLETEGYGHSKLFYTGITINTADGSLAFSDDSGSPDFLPAFTGASSECVALAYDSDLLMWWPQEVNCSKEIGYLCEITRVDGAWSSWESWSSCSQTCDEAANMGYQSRVRACDDPQPLLGGTNCTGNNTDLRVCGTQCPAVDGVFSDWSEWDVCPITCGNNGNVSISRTRSCDNPAPMYGGANCTGNDTESKLCATNPCIVDGDWSVWDSWGECSVTCASGYEARSRTCTAPAPEYGGENCTGISQEIRVCENVECPVDGEWASWESWGDCSKTCGNGTQTRNRTCTNPEPQYNGNDCVGMDTDSQECNTAACPVAGGLTDWSNWGACSVTCSSGTQSRTRSCTNPAPANGGDSCVGDTTESKSCDDGDCPVDGGWNDWSDWSACSEECTFEGNKTRTRTCSNPSPANGGANCSGSNSDSQSCTVTNCPVNGGWDDWGTWSSCSVACGTLGAQFRTRTCSNPTPAYEGDDCVGSDTEGQSCTAATATCTGNVINIATGRTASMSSTVNSNDNSADAIDGSTSTCSSTSSESYNWWKIDLNGVYAVSTISITFNSSVSDYEVRVGTNTDISQNSRCDHYQTSSSTTITLSCTNPIPGRYVSIYRNSDISLQLEICEVEVYAAPLAFYVNGGSSNSLNYTDAQAECLKYGAQLASSTDLTGMYNAGINECSLGWLDDQTVRKPVVYPSSDSSSGCGNTAGVINGGSLSTSTQKDAYCIVKTIEDLALGMAGNGISDSQITVSSSLTDNLNGTYARLYLSSPDLAWVADSSDSSPYILINLLVPTTLKAFAMSGCPDRDSWVKTLYVQYGTDSADSSSLSYIQESNNNKLFYGNFDDTTVVRHSLAHIPSVYYVRFEPHSWEVESSMRLELYGRYEPVSGTWVNWADWQSCDEGCGAVGVQKRKRECSNLNGAPTCKYDKIKHLQGDPLQYFEKTLNSKWNTAYSEITDTVDTDTECARFCLDDSSCASFDYSEDTSTCRISSSAGGTLTSDNSYDYYVLVHLSCNTHYLVGMGRGETLQDTTYNISIDETTQQVYCDMTHYGGGWTLLITSKGINAWTSLDIIRSKNEDNPATDLNYSILGKGDTIKNTGKGKTFKYRLETAYGRYGGIWEGLSSYSLVEEDNTIQSTTLVERFDTWTEDQYSLQSCVPFMDADFSGKGPILTTRDPSTTNWWGTIIRNYDNGNDGSAKWIKDVKEYPTYAYYWLREDRAELIPTEYWQMDGLCEHDTSDYASCYGTDACDTTVRPTFGEKTGTLSTTFELRDSTENSQHDCALHFEDSYVNFGTYTEICLVDPSWCALGFTINFWMKFNKDSLYNSGSSSRIYSAGGQSSYLGTVIHLSSSHGVVYRTRNSAGVEYSTTYDGGFPDNTWFMMTFTYNPDSGTKLYFDGELVSYDDSSSSSSNTVANTKFMIGLRDYDLLYKVENMDFSDLSIYYYDLSASEVKKIFYAFGGAYDSQDCTGENCPINGGWDTWSSWGSCSVDCDGGGKQSRTRSCSNPTPAYDGTDCSGDDIEWQACSSSTSCDTYYGGEATNALGMQDGSIPDANLAVSEDAGDGTLGGTYARMGDSDGNSAWVPANPDTGDYIQIELPYQAKILKVGISGRPNHAQYVTSYYLSYSNDGSSWTNYTQSSSTVTLDGCIDQSTEVITTITAITAWYVRLYPLTWEAAISMRVELYGNFVPIDGDWGSWTSWSECSVTCGGGSQSRSHTCDNPSPLHNGAGCSGSTSETQNCNDDACPVDGYWNSWYDISECSVNCGDNGVKLQARDCVDPLYGGNDLCTGDSQQWVTCSASGSCDSTTNYALGVKSGGTYTIEAASITASSGSAGDQARLDGNNAWTPTNPDPPNDWLMIELPQLAEISRVAIKGHNNEYVKEYYLEYTANGNGHWQSYLEDGVVKLFHGCLDDTNPSYSNLSVDNVDAVKIYPATIEGGGAFQVELYGIYNPIDGNWGNWTSWTTCTKTCANGTQTHTRTCDNPAASYDGAECVGSNSESQACETQNCPVDGQWDSWEDMINCSVDCESNGVVQQSRDCIPPQYGGDYCIGDNTTWAICSGTLATCSASDNYALGVKSGGTYTIEAASITASSGIAGDRARLDGNNAWSPSDSDAEDNWIKIELPDKATLARIAVQGYSSDYVNEFFLEYSLNGSDWSFYLDSDGENKVFHGPLDDSTPAEHSLSGLSEVLAVRITPISYTGSVAIRTELYGLYNPIDGVFTDWSDWSTCSVTCGGSTQTRTRTCTNPSAQYLGNECTGITSDTQQCGTESCPISGGWADWAAWSTLQCSVDCGEQGVKYRDRTCTNPPPEHGGGFCETPNLTEQFQTCDSVTSCTECDEALGVYDSRISNAQMNASSTDSETENLAYHARMNIGSTEGEQCWVPQNVSGQQWLEVGLDTPATISMVGVQGSSVREEYVTYYSLQIQYIDNENFVDYENGSLLYGNIDSTGIVKTSVNSLKNVTAVRFLPKSFHGNTCLRVEIYGCYDTLACPGTDEIVGQTPALSSSTTYGNDELTLDLGALYKLTVVSTKGKSGAWLEQYTFYYSTNDYDWSPYREGNTTREFVANGDDTQAVSYPLNSPVHARYIKFVIDTYQGSLNQLTTAELQFYGCDSGLSLTTPPSTQVCFDSFGLADHSSVARLSASSVLQTDSDSAYQANFARLWNYDSPNLGLSGWVSDLGSRVNSTQQYLQVDFNEHVTVTGIAVQGVEGISQDFHMDTFSLWYTFDSGVWKSLNKFNSTHRTIFTGPKSGTELVYYELHDQSQDVRPLTLKSLRIKSELSTSDAVGLRLEVYGCSDTEPAICRDGWYPFGHSCYKVENKDQATYAEAEANCTADGGYLVSIGSMAEQEYIAALVASLPASIEKLLIGLNRLEDFGTFVWGDQSFYAYSKWAEGQPLDDNLERRSCVAATQGDGYWATVDCSKSLYYMCEYRRNTTTIYTCGENFESLTCENNEEIDIESVKWWREDSNIQFCPQADVLSSFSCNPSLTSNVTTVSECQDEIHCSFLVDNSVFGETCDTASVYKYSEITYDCLETSQRTRACEGEVLKFDCPDEKPLIKVLDAMFGRTMDRSVCSVEGDDTQLSSNCVMSNAIDVVKAFCEDQHSCRVLVEPEIFNDDPCPGTKKYLDVNYTCEAIPAVVNQWENQGDCEDDWTKYEEKCYRAFTDDQLSHNAAGEYCTVDQHGTLAGVPSTLTDDFLAGLIPSNANGSFWIGCVKTNNDTCRWADGIGHAYTDFHTIYDSGPNQTCIELSAEHNYDWDDAHCSIKNNFICQQDCMLSFGLSDRRIRSSQIQVSSTRLVATLNTFSWMARLHNPSGGWVASAQDIETPYFQVDFEMVARVRKIATQGHPSFHYWVSNYTVDYAVHYNSSWNETKIEWVTYTENEVTKYFEANTDKDGVVLNYLDEFMFARHIRIYPVNWEEYPALRTEFYGCYLKDDKPVVVEVTNTTFLHYNYDGNLTCMAFGSPLPNITWERHGWPYQGGPNATIVQHIDGDYYTISVIQFHPLLDDRGWYTCVAANQHGTNRKSFYQSKGLRTYEDPDEVITCDADDLVIECPSPSQYIQINTARYSREHNEVCVILDDNYATECEYEPDLIKYRVETQCNNKALCKLHVNELMFEKTGTSYSSCEGYTKYLNITYDCLDYKWSDWTNNPTEDGNDNEILVENQETTDLDICWDPVNAECVVASDEDTAWYQTDDDFTANSHTCTTYGLLCKKINQAGNDDSCEDYKIRYKCPYERHREFKAHRVVECEGNMLDFGCSDFRYMVIREAIYGRAEEGLCVTHENTSYIHNCTIAEDELNNGDDLLLETLKANCDNKQYCNMYLNLSTILNDPCSGLPKYVDLMYTCEKHGQNIALMKSNSGSSSISEGSLARVTDGILDTSDPEFCLFTEEESSPFWFTDLGASYEISHISVMPNDIQPEVEVRIGNSSDIANSVLCGIEELASTVFTQIFCGEVIRGRYIHIVTPTSVNQSTTLGLCEVEAFMEVRVQQRAVGCQGDVMTLTCADTRISIDDTSYGRSGSTICLTPSASAYDDCSLDTAEKEEYLRQLVVESCHGRRWCQLNITEINQHYQAQYGASPCPDVHAYLTVDFSCTNTPGTYVLNGMKGEADREKSSVAMKSKWCLTETSILKCSDHYMFLNVTKATLKPSPVDTMSFELWNRCPNSPNNTKVSGCEDVDATENLQRHCKNKHDCTFYVNDFNLIGHLPVESDCFSVTRFLEVEYTCQETVPTNESITIRACYGYDEEAENKEEAHLAFGCSDDDYIDIVAANYGRTSAGNDRGEITCQNSGIYESAMDTETTDCLSTGNLTLVHVMEKCQDKRYCTLDMIEFSEIDDNPPIACNDVSKYLEVEYLCQATRPLGDKRGDLVFESCEDQALLELTCPDEAPYVRIISAFYGRREGKTQCSYYQKEPTSWTNVTSCTIPDVVDQIRDLCQHKQTCDVPHNFASYADSDPCPGVHKYLEIKWRCLIKPLDLLPAGEYMYYLNPAPQNLSFALTNNLLAGGDIKVRNFLDCLDHCRAKAKCVSFNYKNTKEDGGYSCQLNSMLMDEKAEDFLEVMGYEYYEVESYKYKKFKVAP